MARIPSQGPLHNTRSPAAVAQALHKLKRLPLSVPINKYTPESIQAAQQRLRNRRRDALAPDFDVRETDSAFYLEGELPGIASTSAIRLHWIDRRTLTIEATVEKVDLEAEWGLLRPIRGTSVQSSSDGDDMVVDKSPAVEGVVEANAVEDKPSKPVVREWLAERRCGQYQRTFTFPTDVDAEAIRARLGQGLLRVLVPKVVRTGVDVKRVSVDDCEE
ncbi:hypothetical protein IWX90DRAFT_487347 [Phyllosticta citrichinensis]|uniref:SHSP domain-containing protein n=1 Tax=Phyllosticta citrichinensis TaxID=1130410 RepID=A0ABR1XR67_9PEZI